MKTRKAVCVLSGGLDSSTALYWLLHEGYEVHALTIQYGQKARQEIAHAKALCIKNGVRQSILHLGDLGALLGANALTDHGIEIPHGGRNLAHHKVTFVSNRNAILFSIAYAIAAGEKASIVGVGLHRDDWDIEQAINADDYVSTPDCSPLFLEALNKAFRVGNASFAPRGLKIVAPFHYLSKAKVVQEGVRIGLHYEDTWSCYHDGDVQCGECGACLDRRAAFKDADQPDPTQYLR